MPDDLDGRGRVAFDAMVWRHRPQLQAESETGLRQSSLSCRWRRFVARDDEVGAILRRVDQYKRCLPAMPKAPRHRTA